jgi:hypothetical protein
MRSIFAGIVLGFGLVWGILSWTNAKALQYQPAKVVIPDSDRYYLFRILDYNYKDFKKLDRIIRAESNWRMVHNPRTNDWGYCQINEATWGAGFDFLGLDYKTNPRQHLIACVLIYKVAGEQSWSASMHKWK